MHFYHVQASHMQTRYNRIHKQHKVIHTGETSASTNQIIKNELLKCAQYHYFHYFYALLQTNLHWYTGH